MNYYPTGALAVQKAVVMQMATKKKSKVSWTDIEKARCNEHGFSLESVGHHDWGEACYEYSKKNDLAWPLPAKVVEPPTKKGVPTWALAAAVIGVGFLLT